ncbi:MAG: hypothetical protein U5L09_01100 [Bacteroidales bacterium]|nr:hypothetical protein [Bacteroidales bacterium]
MQEPDERQFLEQFNILMEEATANGYEQYEISNFCTGEKYARHNTAYWFGEPYLGVGPSAHSFDGKKRTWNIAHLKKYIEGIDEGNPALESETLTTAQAYNEFVMTRLRTKWGVPADSLPNFMARR